MTRRSRTLRTINALAVCSAFLLLAGCAPHPGDGVVAFQREQLPSDRLPEEIPDYGREELDPASTRLLFDDDGIQYFAARGADANDLCLVMYGPSVDWMAACSPNLPIEARMHGSKALMFMSGSSLPDSDTWMPVADNLAIER